MALGGRPGRKTAYDFVPWKMPLRTKWRHLRSTGKKIHGRSGEVYFDSMDRGIALEFLAQRIEERERTGNKWHGPLDGVDERGLTVEDRIVWRRFLSGF